MHPHKNRSKLLTASLLGAALLSPHLARAQTLLCATGANFSDGQLFIVNPASGSATLVGNIVDVNGPISITGLAFHPSTRVLYAVSGNLSQHDERSLFSIDASTGAATLIGPLGGTAAVMDIAFAADGTLYGWMGGGFNKLVQIDLASGEASPVDPDSPGAGRSNGNAFSITSNDLAWVSRTDPIDGSTILYGVDLADGTFTDSLPLTGLPEFTSLNAMSFDTDGNLYAVNNDAGTAALVLVDATTGQVTEIGPLPSNTDGLAFEPEINSGIVGRYVFYNGSPWDGNDGTANSNDDAAIATDKTALFPGETATFANYTSYTRGLNGIMIDGNFANAAAISAADFTFRAGNDNTPATWTTPAAPGVTLRAGAGVGGSDRLTLTWPNNAIVRQWLQVTVLATAATGLAAPDIFYFGNAPGESGNNTSNAQVNVADEIAARNNLNPIGPVPITNRFDYNRDKRINLADEIAARNNIAVVTALRLIAP